MKLVIAICTAIRDAYLATQLAYLGDIDFSTLDGQDISLLVVDNRPGGETAAICNSARAQLPIKLDLVEDPAPGIAQARNRAVATALQQIHRQTGRVQGWLTPRAGAKLYLLARCFAPAGDANVGSC